MKKPKVIVEESSQELPKYQTLLNEILEEIYNLRTDPKAFAQKLEEESRNYKSNNARHRTGTVPVQTREGLKALKSAINDLESLESLSPLELSAGLTAAAISHCNDTGPLGIVGHIGSHEETLQQRVEKYGKWSENIAEALDYGSSSGFEVVSSLLIDDGLTTRPHRKSLLNPNYTKIGVGVAPHSEFKTVVCILFAVAYEDNEDVVPESIDQGTLPKNPEIDEWLDGAVKLTFEIRVETESGKSLRKAKKYWEMADGSVEITEEVLDQRPGSRASNL
jgi:uncharacterized protein YkwD